MTTSPTLTGTNSATVIQSMPSMKLVRLTNHRQASSSSARSTHHGSTGTTRSSAGRPASTMPTASACRTSRGATSMRPDIVGQAPTAAMNAVAAKTSQSEPGSNDGSGADREGAGGDGDGRGDDGDAAALRRGLAMRRPCVGMRERITLQQRQQCEDDAGADGGRSGDDESELSTVHQSSFRNRRRIASRAASISRDCDRDQPSAGRSPRRRNARRPAGAPPRHNGLASSGDVRQASRSRRPSAGGSSNGTSRPVSPGRTISRHPGTSVAIIGRPQAAASSRLFGRPSRRDGNTAMWARAQSAEMSSTWPSQVMPGSRPQPAASCSLTEAGLAGSGVPAISSSTFEPRSRSSRWARDQRVNALVGEQPADKSDGRAAWRLRHAAAAHRRRRPSPGSARCVPAAMPSESMPSRSSGFCTSTNCLGRLSNRRSSALMIGPQQQRLRRCPM